MTGLLFGLAAAAALAASALPAGEAPLFSDPGGDLAVTAKGTTTPRKLSDRLGETLNVLDFGCVGDDVADDGPCIQAALDAAVAQRKALYFPAPSVRYRTRQPLVLSRAQGITIHGSNARTTVIYCALGAGDTCLTMRNCGWVTWRSLGFRGSDTLPLRAIWNVEVDTKTGESLSTSMRVDNVRIVGGDAYAEFGVRYTVAAGSAAKQNDLSIWTAAVFQKFRRAAVSFEHENSKQHVFRDCQMTYLGRGLPSDGSWAAFPTDEGYGVWAHPGSFRWHDGAVAIFKGAAFRADGLSTEGATVDGTSFESGARIFDFAGTSSEPSVIRIEGNRYSAAYLRAPGAASVVDAAAIRMTGAVVASIRGNRFGQAGQTASPRIVFENDDPSYVEIVGNEWETTGADAVANLVVAPSATELEMHGNTYRRRDGSRTLKRERRLQGVESIQWAPAAPGEPRGHNLRGSVTIAGTASTGEVRFATLGGNEPDVDYYVAMSPAHGLVGRPAAGASRVRAIVKRTTGLVIELEAAPGAGSSVTYDWILVR